METIIMGRSHLLLLVCSGEGTLSAFDIRKHKLLLQSELLDSGLLSVAIVKVSDK